MERENFELAQELALSGSFDGPTKVGNIFESFDLKAKSAGHLNLSSKGRFGNFVLASTAALGIALGACQQAEETPKTPNPQETPTREIIIDPTCSFAANRLIVDFEGDEPSRETLEIIEKFDALRIEKEREPLLEGAWTLEVDPNRREELKKELIESGDVEYAEEDSVISYEPIECTPTAAGSNE